MPRKKRFVPKPFESTGVKGDTSANIYMSMLTHPAFLDLKPRAQILYVYCKAQLYAEKRKTIVDGRECFTMNQAKWHGLYGLYSLGNRRAYYEDMSSLIDHGFIDCLHCGAISRTKNLFCFSDRWQQWGQPDYSVPENVKTMALQHKK